MSYQEKLKNLKQAIAKNKNYAIAMSGGIDSSVLAHIIKSVPGTDVFAIIVKSPYLFSSDILDAEQFCQENNIKYNIMPFDIPDEKQISSPNRCYFCKHALYTKIIDYSDDHGCYIVVDGSIYSDVTEHKAGSKALKELGIWSPLYKFGFDEKEIREYAEKYNLNTQNNAPNTCLLSRFPKLKLLDTSISGNIEKAEKEIKKLGFFVVRLRHYGEFVKLEVLQQDIKKVVQEKTRKKIIEILTHAGYKEISIDLVGYEFK